MEARRILKRFILNILALATSLCQELGKIIPKLSLKQIIELEGITSHSVILLEGIPLFNIQICTIVTDVIPACANIQ